MSQKDTLQRFMFEDLPIRGEIVHLNATYLTIIKQHGYPKLIQRLLGEALVAAALLSATLKYKGQLSLQFQGEGALSLLLVKCDEQLHLRALATCWDDMNEEQLNQSLASGQLVITIQPENSTQHYQGVVSLAGNSLAQGLETYFEKSEQLPTKIWLAVSDEQAAGYLVQALPGKESEHEQDEMAWEFVCQISNTITEAELLNLSHETLLYRLFHEEYVRLFEEQLVSFRCKCSLERMENAILLMGKESAEQLLAEEERIIVTCEFCNRHYAFDQVDVARLFSTGSGSDSKAVH